MSKPCSSDTMRGMAVLTIDWFSEARNRHIIRPPMVTTSSRRLTTSDRYVWLGARSVAAGLLTMPTCGSVHS